MKALSAAGRLAPLLVILALLGLRLCLLDSAPLLPAEVQQAHVAWSWNQGRLPYRDVMDLEPPLLAWWQRLPLRVAGPDPRILDWLRLTAQLWYGLSLYALWRIGRAVYGAGPGLAALLLVGLYPAVFSRMGQATVDAPWCALTLGALAILLGGPGGRRRLRPWLAGVLGGLGLCLSLQMTWLLSLLATAALVLGLRQLQDGSAPPLRRFAWGLAGLALMPVLWLLWLSGHGGLPALLACLADEALGAGGLLGHGWLLASLLLALAGLAVPVLSRWPAPAGPRPAWRLYLGLCGWLYLTLIVLAWPWYGQPDFMPLGMLFWLVLWGELGRLPSWQGRRGGLACATLVALELACILAALPPGRDALQGERQLLRTVLHYSAAGDMVMDGYGAAIFRQRPYYPLLQPLQGWPGSWGRRPDTVADELVRNATHLVVREDLPPQSDSFVASHYLQLQDNVYAAALPLPAVQGEDVERTVQLDLPGDYTLSDGRQAVAAEIDGHPAATHWRLQAGTHYVQTPTDAPLLLLDSHAWDAGWRPALAPAGHG